MTYLTEAERAELIRFSSHHEHTIATAEKLAARVATEAEAKALETAERAIEAARDKLHPAFGEGDANLPRGYTSAARIVRALRAEASR